MQLTWRIDFLPELDDVRARAFAADDRRGRQRTVPKLPRKLKKAFRRRFQACIIAISTHDGVLCHPVPGNRREWQQEWLATWVSERNDYDVYGPLVRDGVEQMLANEDREILNGMLRSEPGLLGSGLVCTSDSDIRALFTKAKLDDVKVVDNQIFGKYSSP